MKPGPERDEANRKVDQYVKDRIKGFMGVTGTVLGGGNDPAGIR